MSGKLSPENAIVKVSKEFIDDMRENIFTSDEEQEELLLGECWLQASQPSKILNLVIKHVLPHRENIRKRNLQFFIENQFIFSGLPPHRIKYYSEKLASGEVPQDDMNVCFDFLNSMVDIAEKSQEVKKNE